MYLTSMTSLCLLLAFVTSAHSATVTLEPSADTALWELGPDNNLGGTLLYSGTTAIPSKSRTLVKFDVADSVPAGVTITSASLRLVVVKVPVERVFDPRLGRARPIGRPPQAAEDADAFVALWLAHEQRR